MSGGGKNEDEMDDNIEMEEEREGIEFLIS